MTQISFQGSPVNTCGTLPAVGSKAPDFTLVGGDLSEKSLSDYRGELVILNIFPSIDTPTCATSTKRFNKELETHNVKVLCISIDLPFAQGRFCGSEGTDKVTTLSCFRNPEFGVDYGVTITDSVLKGLLARAVVVINKDGVVVHSELVADIASEPNYEAALNAK